MLQFKKAIIWHPSSVQNFVQLTRKSFHLNPIIFLLISPFFGVMGATASIVFCCFGAAYGTAKSGVGIAAMGVMRPELIMKSVVPVVMVRY